MNKHNWQPTDTSGHCLECSNCGKETSIYRKDYKKTVDELCNGIGEIDDE